MKALVGASNQEKALIGAFSMIVELRRLIVNSSNQDLMMRAFTKPKIKVGTEWVTKGQNVGQATNSVGGIARGIYSRLFNYLILKCNDTLIDATMKKVNFCAVLDIAGFEIFEYNGFEQISINFVNEKLQQFFNHHMFVVEQEEYVKEGIDWEMVDFGMDLQAAKSMPKSTMAQSMPSDTYSSCSTTNMW